MTVDDTYIVTAVSSAFTVLTGAIAAMWLTLKAESRNLRKRADDCEQHRLKLEADKIELWKAIAELKGDSDMLERCPAAKCPMRNESGEDAPRPGTSRIFLSSANLRQQAT
jgi:hypothetical protein